MKMNKLIILILTITLLFALVSSRKRNSRRQDVTAEKDSIKAYQCGNGVLCDEPHLCCTREVKGELQAKCIINKYLVFPKKNLEETEKIAETLTKAIEEKNGAPKKSKRKMRLEEEKKRKEKEGVISCPKGWAETKTTLIGGEEKKSKARRRHK